MTALWITHRLEELVVRARAELANGVVQVDVGLVHIQTNRGRVAAREHVCLHAWCDEDGTQAQWK